MIRPCVILVVYFLLSSSFTHGDECRIEDIAGRYQSQWGEVSCSAVEGQLVCCYGNVQQCGKQLFLVLSPDGGVLEGRWEYSNGSKGPARFSIDENCHLDDGFWGSGATANSAWSVGDRIGTMPAVVPSSVTKQCRPGDLGLYYQTNLGPMDCEATDLGMDCRFPAEPVDGCERTLLLTIDRDGRALRGSMLDAGFNGAAGAELDGNCNIQSGFWRAPRGRSFNMEINALRDAPPGTSAKPSDGHCGLEDIARFYGSNSGNYACEIKGSTLQCCQPPPHESLAEGWTCSRRGMIRVRLTDDRTGVIGKLVRAEQYESVNLPLNERCHLAGGSQGSCKTPGKTMDLNFVYDPLSAGDDLSLAQTQYDAASYHVALQRIRDALPYLTEAADKGHVEAQFELAVLLENGAGDPQAKRATYIVQDVERATELYALAAASGHVKAKQSLARRKKQQAQFEAIVAQADAGDAEVQFQLAQLYLSGKLVSYDIEQYLAWLKRAADQEHPAALYEYGSFMYKQTRDDAEKAKAFAMIQRAGDLGYARAWVYLASRAFHTERSYNKARELLTRAMNSDDELAVRLAKWRLADYQEILGRQRYEAWLNSPEGIRHQMQENEKAFQRIQQQNQKEALDDLY
jgi:TPR repeat protein